MVLVSDELIGNEAEWVGTIRDNDFNWVLELNKRPCSVLVVAKDPRYLREDLLMPVLYQMEDSVVPHNYSKLQMVIKFPTIGSSITFRTIYDDMTAQRFGGRAYDIVLVHYMGLKTSYQHDYIAALNRLSPVRSTYLEDLNNAADYSPSGEGKEAGVKIN